MDGTGLTEADGERVEDGNSVITCLDDQRGRCRHGCCFLHCVDAPRLMRRSAVEFSCE
jgi:hypothetical protein